jgi:hypothetical protein
VYKFKEVGDEVGWGDVAKNFCGIIQDAGDCWQILPCREVCEYTSAVWKFLDHFVDVFWVRELFCRDGGVVNNVD